MISRIPKHCRRKIMLALKYLQAADPLRRYWTAKMIEYTKPLVLNQFGEK